MRCCECNREIDAIFGDYYVFNERVYCPVCVEEHFNWCFAHRMYEPRDTTREYRVSRFGEELVVNMCQAGAEREICTCDVCGNEVLRIDTRHDSHNEHICSGCFQEMYAECGECGNYVPRGDISRVYIRGGGPVDCCPDCLENVKINHSICYYSYKPIPVFYCCNGASMFGSPSPVSHERPYMGVELEVDKGHNPNKMAYELNELRLPIYCKHDGSLTEYGVEIVTHPATLEAHMKGMKWDSIRDVCRRYGFLSHDAATCGLHVHVNRDFFSTSEPRSEDGNDVELAIAKIIIMVNTLFDNHLFPFSRRKGPDLEHYAQKNVIELSDGYKNRPDIDKCRKITSDNYDAGRYRLVNIQNDHTIEFRLFRGTLNLNTLFATLQLVEKLCIMAKRISLDDAYNVRWDDVARDMPEEFNKYCETINFITGCNESAA